MGRAPCCDKANVKKGPWSPEEDSKLKDYIDKYGTGGNWIALPHKAGLRRCGKSCRLRWLNYLRPNIKHGEFTEEEDMIICSLFANIGSRWSVIAAQLPGRTDNDIKNYWNTKLKKKLIGAKIASFQRKPNQQQQNHHHQDPFASDPINFKTPPPLPPTPTSSYNFSSKQMLSSCFEGIPISCNSSSSSSELIFNNPANYQQLLHHQYRTKGSSTLLVFGSETCCSSSTEGSCTQNISHGSKELDYQMNISSNSNIFENYLYGSGLDHQNQNLMDNGLVFFEDPLASCCTADHNTTKTLANPSSSNNSNNNGFLADPTSIEQGRGLYFY